MKKFITFLTIAAFCLIFAVQTFAAGEPVVDGADLLSQDEEQSLTSQLSALKDKYGLDVIVVTTRSIGGKTLEAFADDYYDQNGYGPDGIELLVNMDEDHGGADRRYVISTAGYGINAFTDYGIERIYDDISSYMSAGDFYGAFSQYGSDADWMIESAKNGKPYDYYTDPANIRETPTFANVQWGGVIIFAIFIGVAGALIFTLTKKKQHRTVTKQTSAGNYMVPGSLNLTKSTDTFLFVNVTHVPIPRDNTPKGGSSTHFSSGGIMHGGGGGGRSF